MELSIELVRTFAAVADLGGFTRAAGAVNRTQSAVSQQVKRLEAEVGAALFDRAGREVRLTPAGTAFMPYARRLLAVHDEAVDALARPDMAGHVRLGTPADFVDDILPDILSDFAQRHPRVQVEVRFDPGQASEDLVAAGELDLAIAIVPEVPEGARVLAREPLVWIACARCLAHEQSPVPLAVFDEHCFYRRWGMRALDAAGVSYRLAYVSPSVQGIKAAVLAGLAVAPVGLHSVPEGARVLGPENGFPTLPVATVVLVVRPDRASEPVRRLAEVVVEGFSCRW